VCGSFDAKKKEKRKKKKESPTDGATHFINVDEHTLNHFRGALHLD